MAETANGEPRGARERIRRGEATPEELEAAREGIYQPKDAVGESVKALGVTATTGFLISAIQNTLTRQNVGAMSVFTRTGGTIAVFGAMGVSYAFASCAAANLREKDDAINPAIGGFFSGAMLGLRFRSAPAVLGYGVLVGTVLAGTNYGGTIMKSDPNVDELAEKELLKSKRRRPIEETVHALGEGRGIYAPGYEERRAERIKERYGIDVTNPAPAWSTPSKS